MEETLTINIPLDSSSIVNLKGLRNRDILSSTHHMQTFTLACTENTRLGNVVSPHKCEMGQNINLMTWPLLEHPLSLTVSAFL